MTTVVLPSLLAAQAGGRKRFEVEAATVGDALRALPVADLLFDEHGELRRLVNVYVDGADARQRDGVATALRGGETILVLQAVAGGSGRGRKYVPGWPAKTEQAKDAGSPRT